MLLLLGLPYTSWAQSDSVLALTADTVAFSNQKFFDFIKQASFENKPYLVFFNAPWCAPCHRIKQEIFTHPKIAALVNNSYLAYTIDLDNLDGAETNSRFFNVQQLPTILFFDPKGKQTDKAIGYFDGYYLFKKIRSHIPPSQRGKDWLQE